MTNQGIKLGRIGCEIGSDLAGVEEAAKVLARYAGVSADEVLHAIEWFAVLEDAVKQGNHEEAPNVSWPNSASVSSMAVSSRASQLAEANK